MVLSLEDEVSVEIIEELRKKEPNLENNLEEFYSRYNQEKLIRINSRKSVKNRVPWDDFFSRWLNKYIDGYESLSVEEQRERDWKVLKGLAFYCCNMKGILFDSYKLYWKEVKRLRK